MTAVTHLDMHGDHRLWQSETAMWRDDIHLWQEEYQKTLTDLVRLEAALRERARAIHAHGVSIQEHEAHLGDHERALATYERGDKGDELVMLTLAKAHRGENMRHTRLRRFHETLKRQHHGLIAHWSLLLKQVTDAAGGEAL